VAIVEGEVMLLIGRHVCDDRAASGVGANALCSTTSAYHCSAS